MQQQVFRQLYTQVKVYTIAEDHSKQDDLVIWIPIQALCHTEMHY